MKQTIRRLKVVPVIVGATLAIGLLPGSAAAADCSGTTAAIGFNYDTNRMAWSGHVVGCPRSRTYSLRLRLYSDSGAVYDENILQGKSGNTHYSIGTFYTFIAFPKDWCTTVFLYHSSTVGNNKVGQDTDCI